MSFDFSYALGRLIDIPDNAILYYFMQMHSFTIQALGDAAIEICLGDAISPNMLDQVTAVSRLISDNPPPGLLDVIPAYTSVTLLFDRAQFSPTNIDEIAALLAAAPETRKTTHTEDLPILHIPVCYEPPFGTDLLQLSDQLQLPISEIVSLHCTPTYRVYMMGFLPGFPYMGIVPEAMQLPRKPQPAHATSGSVAIAGSQTGIYPVDSPGGWWCIGSTPLRSFNSADPLTVLWQPGDQVRFIPVSLDAFHDIQGYSKHLSFTDLRLQGGWPL